MMQNNLMVKKHWNIDFQEANNSMVIATSNLREQGFPKNIGG